MLSVWALVELTRCESHGGSRRGTLAPDPLGHLFLKFVQANALRK